MNRTVFFSIVGLGVFSAAGFAGPRSQPAGLVTCTDSSPSAPVVLVTQPDGNCVVARCVAVTACDPKTKGQAGAKAYTFTTQGGLTGGCGSSSTNAGPSTGGLVTFSGSGSSSASCGAATLAIPLQETGAQGGVATVTVQGDGSQTSNKFQRLFKSSESAPSAPAAVDIEPVIVEFDGDEPVTWRADLEHALAAAQGRYSVNQDEMREAWQRATEEARAAHERAREAYDDAMERYRDAMQAAKERSRETHERALVERKAKAEAEAQGGKRKSSRAGDKARADHDATLEARIEALEEAARGRGQKVDSKRSLEERVEQLEKLNTTSWLAPYSGLLKLQRENGLTTTPLPRTFRRQSPNALAPAQPSPRSAPTPPSQPAPFRNLRSGQPGAPAAPAPGAMRNEERQDMARAMDDLKREAKRLREELARMRAEVERLPRVDSTR